MWTGMAPVYMKACVQALLGGRHRKPVYKVTRKQDDLRWHWRHTLPHTTVVLVVFVGIYALRYGALPSASLLAGAVYWGGLNVVLLTGFVAAAGTASGGSGVEPAQRPRGRRARASQLFSSRPGRVRRFVVAPQPGERSRRLHTFVYCLAAEELAEELLAPLRAHYRCDPDVKVIADRRKTTQPSESDSAAIDDGRAKSDRRRPVLPRDLAAALPPALAARAGELRREQRLRPVRRRLQDTPLDALLGLIV